MKIQFGEERGFGMSGGFRLLLCGVAALCALGTTHIAAAQDKPAAPVVTVAPDVVRMKDGSLLRGTIAELRAHDKVTIVLITGETRTIAMSDVEFAGPAQELPKAAAPVTDAQAQLRADAAEAERRAAERRALEELEARRALRADANEVELQLNGGPEYTYYVKTGHKTFSRLCTAPCTARLPRGQHQIAVSKGDRSPVVAQQSLDLNTNTSLYAAYRAKTSTRGAGIAIYVMGGIASAVFYGLHLEDEDSDYLLASGLTSVASVGIGTALVLQRDQVNLEIGTRPAVRRPEPRVADARAVTQEKSKPIGLGLSFSF